MPESLAQSRLLLDAPRALPDLRLFRRNVGAGKLASGQFVHFGIRGQCDLYGLQRGGRHIELELKARNGKLSEFQQTWRDWCLGHGVPWLMLVELRGETVELTTARWIDEIRQALFR